MTDQPSARSSSAASSWCSSSWRRSCSPWRSSCSAFGGPGRESGIGRGRERRNRARCSDGRTIGVRGRPTIDSRSAPRPSPTVLRVAETPPRRGAAANQRRAAGTRPRDAPPPQPAVDAPDGVRACEPSGRLESRRSPASSGGGDAQGGGAAAKADCEEAAPKAASQPPAPKAGAGWSRPGQRIPLA